MGKKKRFWIKELLASSQLDVITVVFKNALSKSQITLGFFFSTKHTQMN